ncbi:hypothetical protein FOZ63_027672, partial [Perkinsus olseni]
MTSTMWGIHGRGKGGHDKENSLAHNRQSVSDAWKQSEQGSEKGLCEPSDWCEEAREPSLSDVGPAPLSKPQRSILDHNFVSVSDGWEYGPGVKAGWLYCRLCDKKCDRFEIMLGHLASLRHQERVAAVPRSVIPLEAKASGQRAHHRLWTLEDLEAGEPVLTDASLVQPAPQKISGNLPKFLSKRGETFFCALCQCGPMAKISLGDHLTGQKHRKQCDRDQLASSLEMLQTLRKSAGSSAASKSKKKTPSQLSTREPLVVLSMKSLQTLFGKRRLLEDVFEAPALQLTNSNFQQPGGGKKRRVDGQKVSLPDSVIEKGEGYYCKLCDARPQNERDMWAHLRGNKHRSNTDRLDLSSPPSASTADSLSYNVSARPFSPPPPSQFERRFPEPPQRLEEALYAPNGALLPPGSREQNGSRSVLLSAAHTMAESGAKKDPPGEGSASYPADGPEKEPPTEQETASPEKSPQAAAEVKKKKVEQKEDEKPDSSSWGRSNRWGEKSPSDSRALGGSLWKSSWDPDRRPNDNPPSNRRNYSSSSWDMPPDWDPQKDYDNLPASQRAILENNFVGLSDGKKYY